MARKYLYPAKTGDFSTPFTCNECGQSIYMAYVQPPNEYGKRYLPFEDESLIDCHLDYCRSHRKKTYVSEVLKKKKVSKKIVLKKPRNDADYVKCLICGCKLNKKNREKHMKKVHQIQPDL